ncbi:hypothetical protein KP509_20G020300 [Ceratopteris richardii]|uniref:Methyltransferase type 11 domain-containing protein n=1 Tax=Ceratopteris richardii TaxID=49495 RepID=A0A8T2SFH8_CERRI|nr:hypothetical protein KP509_20G020300 [Ceratopteris richardii]
MRAFSRSISLMLKALAPLERNSFLHSPSIPWTLLQGNTVYISLRASICSLSSQYLLHGHAWPTRHFRRQLSRSVSLEPEVHGVDCEHQDYGDPSFWDRTYAKGPETLEWYQSYSDIAPLLRRYVPTTCRVLMIGCGNAEISEDMVKNGYNEIVNIDNSAVVIKGMQEKYQHVPQLRYEVMDVLDMSHFGDGSFDSVIDKGTLDAIMCVVGGPYNAGLMMAEVSRVLRPGGIYILITTGNPESRLPLLNVKAFGWHITFYIIPQPDTEMDQEERARAYKEPVQLNADGTYADSFVLENPDSLFVFVCRKTSM